MGQIAMTGLTTARYRIAQEIFILIVAIELLWNDDYNENYKLSVFPAKGPHLIWDARSFRPHSRNTRHDTLT